MSEQTLLIDSEGRAYKMKHVMRYFIDKDGNPKRYQATVKQYVSNLKRGRKTLPHKKKLKTKFSELSDEDCEKLLRVIKLMKEETKLETIEDLSETEEEYDDDSEYIDDTASEYSSTTEYSSTSDTSYTSDYSETDYTETDYTEIDDTDETCSDTDN